MSTTTQSALLWLASMIEISTAIVDGMRDQLASEAPWTALENSDGVFENAARIRVFRTCRQLLEEGGTVESVAQRAIREAIRGARGGSRSTSDTSNLIRRCVTEAWAEVALALGGRQ